MAKQSDYFKLLKHPKWQEKRLQIMKIAQFSCERCEDTEKTLNVHHMYYEKNKKPWEYPDISLHCLCEDCHKKIQSIQEEIKKQMGELELLDLDNVLGYLKGLDSSNFPDTEYVIGSPGEAAGIASYWGVDSNAVVDMVMPIDSRGTINGYILKEMRDRANGKASA